MKTKRTIKSALVGLALLAGVVVMAQNNFQEPPHGPNHHEFMMRIMHDENAGPEMKKELMAYFKDKVFPVVKKLRVQLDDKLTEDEKKTIVSARSSLKANQEAMMKSSMHPKKENGEQPSPEQKEQMKAKHKEMMELMAPVNEIAAKHEKELVEVRKALKSNEEVWLNDLKKIAEKWNVKFPEPKPEHKIKNDSAAHHPHPHHGKGPHGHMPHDGNRMDVHFLLLDPAAASPEEFFPMHVNGERKKGNDEFTTDNGLVKVFPNPVQGVGTIQFKVEKPGSVKIDLLDSEGRLIENLLSEKKENGDYKVSFDMNKKIEGTYYIRYTTDKGSVNKKLLKIQ